MFIKQISKSLEAAVLFGEIDIEKAQTTLKKLSEAKANAKLLQLSPIKNIISPFQVFVAAGQTMNAIETNSSFSKSPELEFLCRLNAESQIDKAINLSELKKGKNTVCLVIVTAGAGKNIAKKQLQEAASKIGMKEKKIDLDKNKNVVMKHFGIAKKELEALSDLKNPLEAAVIERIALLNLTN